MDLETLISAAADNPNQFAVSVPHAITTESAGSWAANADRLTWTHVLQIRGAVSLSFHAPRMRLPDSAALIVRSRATTVTYRSSDVERGSLWSRVQPGDTLELSLEVSAAQTPELEFNTPYILTARHCQNGRYGGGDPSAASSVTVHWDASTTCGTPLGTVHYAPNSHRQTGATTVVEQQDAWLIKLNASPVVDSAHYAGFDASGATVSGGHSIHHALAYNKQYTRWFGDASVYTQDNVLGAPFRSDLMDTVNDPGVSGPGASGAALFTPANLLAGVLSLGRQRTSDSIPDTEAVRHRRRQRRVPATGNQALSRSAQFGIRLGTPAVPPAAAHCARFWIRTTPAC